MRRIATHILAPLLLTLACSIFQSFSTPEPVWTYTSDRIQVNNFDQLLYEVDGNIYAYLSNEVYDVNGLLGLNGSTGQELWTPITNEDLLIFEGVFGNFAIFKGSFSDEAASDGSVLFPIIAYDLQTGTEAWRYIGMPETYPVIGRGEYLFLWKSSTEMDILDLKSGEVLSTYIFNDVDPSEYAESNAAWVHFIYTDTAFYSLSPVGILREYSLPEGKFLGSQQLDTPYYHDVTYMENDRLYLYSGYEIGQDVSLVAYDLSNGEKLWELKDMYSSSHYVEFQNGLGYLNTLQGTSAVDLNSGQVLWSTGGSMNASFVVNAETKGKLLVADSGSMSAYDALSGEKLWTFEPGLDNLLRITAINGVAFVTSGDDPPPFQYEIIPTRLDAIDIETGKNIWRMEQVWVTLPLPSGDLAISAYDKGISAYPLK